MPKEDLNSLPPEEKIKKLKELKKKKKKEIAEAQKMLRETEEELTDRDEWERKVPIPQVAVESMGEMSEAEKEIIRTHKGLREKKEGVGGGENLDEKKERGEELSLEETVVREKRSLPQGLMESEYLVKLSQEPMNNIHQEINNIYQAVEEKGYVSQAEERRIEYLSAATERKLEDIEGGKYSLTEEVAEAALLTRRMGSSLMDMYQRKMRKGERGMY